MHNNNPTFLTNVAFNEVNKLFFLLQGAVFSVSFVANFVAPIKTNQLTDK